MIRYTAARAVLAACAAAAGLAACSRSEPAAPPPSPAAAPAPRPAAQGAPVDAPAGEYTLDPHHASLTFRVDHLGFSHYTARFDRFDARLMLDPAAPEKSSVTATVDARSLGLPSPPEGFLDEIKGPDWLDAARFPEIVFRSTAVEPTGPRTARVTGDLTLHGVTRPVTLEATFNGGYPGHPFDPNARVGFSAHGAFDRSQFGVAYGVPAQGSTFGVSDRVEVQIEGEFSGPPWKAPASAPSPAG